MPPEPLPDPLPASAYGAAATPPPQLDERELVLMKNQQRYVFKYRPGDEGTVLKTLVELAKDPESGFTLFDAAMLSHQLGKGMKKQLERLIKPQ